MDDENKINSFAVKTTFKASERCIELSGMNVSFTDGSGHLQNVVADMGLELRCDDHTTNSFNNEPIINRDGMLGKNCNNGKGCRWHEWR